MATVILTPIEWTNLVPGKVISLSDLGARLGSRLRSSQWQVHSDLWGQGGALDAKTSWTLAADRLTIDQLEAVAYTPTGHRLNLRKTNLFDGLQLVPYEADAGATYRILARWNDYYPVLGGLAGTDGQPYWPYTLEGIGRLVTPTAVVQSGGGTITLTVTTRLLVGERWPNVAYTRQCMVWWQNPVSGGPYRPGLGGIVQNATIAFDGVDYTIDLVPPNLLLGNPAADLTPANFRVLITGPTIQRVGTDVLTTSDAAETVELSRVILGVTDNADAPLINSVGQWINAFNVEHDNLTGHHLDVTADSIEVQALVNTAQNPIVALNQEDGTRVLELRTQLNGSLTGALAFPNVDAGAANKASILLETIGLVPTELEITHGGAGVNHARVLFDGQLRRNPLKNGVIPFAIQADRVADEELIIENVNAGRLDLVMREGELRFDTGGRVNATVAGAGHFFIELDVGAGCSIDALGGIDCQSLEADEGVYVSPVSFGEGYNYAPGEEPDLRWSFPAYGGGWSAENDPLTVRPLYSGTTPLYVGPSALGQALVLRKPLEAVNRLNASAGVTYTIPQIVLHSYRAAATDVVQLSLRRFRRDQTGAEEVVATIVGSVFAAWETVTSVISHSVDLNYVYWLRLTMTANAPGAVADARVGDVVVSYTKTAVE